MADKPIDVGLNQALIERNLQLEAELEAARAVMGRPIDVKVQSDVEALNTVKTYLPQLTHMSTNFSHVASKLDWINDRLTAMHTQQARVIGAVERIADALDRAFPPEKEE